MGIKAKIAPAGETHKRRCNRAKSFRDSDTAKNGTKARGAISKKLERDGKVQHAFGKRNALLIKARKATNGTDQEAALKAAEAIAPLTLKETRMCRPFTFFVASKPKPEEKSKPMSEKQVEKFIKDCDDFNSSGRRPS